MLGNARMRQGLIGQAIGLAAEQQHIPRLISHLRKPRLGMGGKRKHPGRSQRVQRGIQTVMLFDHRQVVIIQPRPLQILIREIKRIRLRQVQHRTGAGGKADRVTRILGDLRLVKNNMERCISHRSTITGRTEHMTQRTYDVVLFGATGFVGKLTAEYLAAHAPAGTRIALAGRNKTKLEAVRDDLGTDWPLLEADSFHPDALAELATSTTTVISTVGPYYRFGLPLVGECARAGTHYVDLCGEVAFMRRSIDEYHELAQSTGAKIVHACGFDSVPSDIGMYLLHRAAAEAGAGPIESATMIVKMKGGLSGGTIDSMRQQMLATKKDPALGKLLADPYSLSPDRAAEADLGPQKDLGTVDLDQFGITDGKGGPFIMASSNTRVVRRSNALLGHSYGPRLRYSEYVYMGTGFAGKKNTWSMMAGLAALVFTLTRPKTRKFFSRWIPEPGEGPTKEQRENGFFSTTTYGKTSDGQTFSATTGLKADPGYKGTSLMLSEAALTLALDAPEGPGGVLTPASGLGDAYIDRLRAAGMRLS